MTAEQAKEFAKEWVRDWNAHDLEAVLSHYTDEFEMSSPHIIRIACEPSGKLKGKVAVRAYWARGLQKFPDLHFEVITVLAGVDSMTLYYRGAGGRLVAEVFFFGSSGKVEKAFAHYAEATGK